MTHVLSILNAEERKHLSNDLGRYKLKNIPFNPRLRDYIINNFSLPGDRIKSKPVLTGAFISDMRNMYKQKYLIKRKELHSESRNAANLVNTFDYLQYSDDESLHYVPESISSKEFSLFASFVTFIGEMTHSLDALKILYNSRNTRNDRKYNKHVLAINFCNGDLPDGKETIILPIATSLLGKFNNKGEFIFFNPKDVMKYTPMEQQHTELVYYNLLWLSGVNGKLSNTSMRAIGPLGIKDGVYDFSDPLQKDTRDKSKMAMFMKNFSIIGDISEMIYGNVEPTKLSVQFIKSLDAITLSNYDIFQKFDNSVVQDNRLVVIGKKGSGKGVLIKEMEKHFDGVLYYVDSDEYGMSIQYFKEQNLSSDNVNDLKQAYIDICKNKDYINSSSFFENTMLNIVSNVNNYLERKIQSEFSKVYSECMSSKVYDFRTFINARIDGILHLNSNAKLMFFVHTYSEAAQICNLTQIINLKPSIDLTNALLNRTTHDRDNVPKLINYKVQVSLSKFYDARISDACLNKSILGILRLYGITPEFELQPIDYSDVFNYTEEDYNEFFALKKDSMYPSYKIKGKTLSKYMTDIKNLHGNIITATLKSERIHVSFRSQALEKLQEFKSLLETQQGRQEFMDFESGIRPKEVMNKYYALGYITSANNEGDYLSNGIYILLNLVKHFKGESLNDILKSRDDIIMKIKENKWFFPNMDLIRISDVVINFFI